MTVPAHRLVEPAELRLGHLRCLMLRPTWSARSTAQRITAPQRCSSPGWYVLLRSSAKCPGTQQRCLQEEAGMQTWVDVVGNVHGRVEVRLVCNHRLCRLPVSDAQPRSSRGRSRVQH